MMAQNERHVQQPADERDTKRFAYTACTVGVGAVLTSHAVPATGIPLAESWAPACLPVIGGRSGSTVNGPVVWPSAADYANVGLPDDGPVLQFDRTTTEITGRQVGGASRHEEYETTIRKTVTNLNILNRLTANIGVEVRSRYTRGPTPAAGAPRQRDLIEVTFNIFNPFVVTTPGVVLVPPLSNPIQLNQDIPRSAGRDFRKFRTGPAADPDSINHLRPGRRYHHHEHGDNGPGGHGHGIIYTALAEPMAQFTYDEPTLDFGKFDVPVPILGAGSSFEVYIGEWAGHPYWQCLTFLRVELKNVQDRVTPRGTFSGEIVIDDGYNGETYP